MIQRKQSIFLLLVSLMSVALLFVPTFSVNTAKGNLDVVLAPIINSDIQSTTGHMAAIFINFGLLMISSLIIFFYNKRQLQITICYVIIIGWLILTAMILFCPFVVKSDSITVIERKFLPIVFCALAVLMAFLAIRNIKKDIELIKSADRIR